MIKGFTPFFVFRYEDHVGKIKHIQKTSNNFPARNRYE